MTSYPYWVTAGTLPNRLEGYSYSSNPELLLFGETTNQPCTVSIPPINGSLPPGTRLEFDGTTVRILGQIAGVEGTETYSFTLRLSNGTYSTDRTFYITATNTLDILEWVTGNSTSLGYYYVAEPTNYQVLAQNTPLKTIAYSFGPIIGWTQGLSIEPATGLLTLDLRWKPSFNYTTLDYTLNNDLLYKCVVAGVSGLANGPFVSGSGIVDSSDPPWEPNSYYIVNTVVTNDNGKIYVCLATGFSSAGPGPTGTGGNIPDGYPTAWSYIGQAAVWNQVTPATSELVAFTVQAATDTQIITRVFQIALLSRPYPPIWQTPSGSLGTVSPRANFDLPLVVFDPDFQGITFSSSNLPTWLNLGVLGELWGSAPVVLSTTFYTFTISASDGIFTVPRTFTVEVAQDPQQISWNSPNDLGEILDGEFSSIQLSAVTNRPGASISYGLSGGSIPPNTIVVSSTGILSGFVEYHAVPKTYFFEVTATDGTDKLPRWFELTVQSGYKEKFLNISIPITGAEKLQFIINNSSSLIAPEYLFREADKNWSRNDSPEVNVVSGLKYSNVEDVKNSISSWLTEFELSYGMLNASEGSGLEYQTLFVCLRDSSSVQSWQPFTSYHSNTRVSTSSGKQFYALVGGTTGDYPEPSHDGTDGSVVWQLVSTPNESTSRNLPLPWYPAHDYATNQTVVNYGETYQAAQNGRSSGGFGPKGELVPITDGQTSWTQGAFFGPNSAYPPSIYNLRQKTISTLGFASSKGDGAQGLVNVNLSTGGIQSVSVVSSGSGYYSQPTIVVNGIGTGARVSALLELKSATLISSSPGFTVGMLFDVSQGTSPGDDFGTVQVGSVNALGIVTSVIITKKGTYSHFPKSNVSFTSGSKTFVVFFDLGIKNVMIDDPGSGYSTETTVSFLGSELLPAWQQEWAKSYVLSVPLAYITMEGAQKFKNTPFIINPYQGQTVEVKQIKMSVQGLLWTGTTTFDADCMTWEVTQTRLVEFDPASETVFDGGVEVFDNDQTWFDHGQMGVVPYSNTIFDENTTIYDYYSTLIDSRASVTASKFTRSWIVNFGKPWQ